MFRNLCATCFNGRGGIDRFGGGFDRFNSGFGGMMGGSWIGPIVMGLLGLLILALIIGLVVWLVRMANRNRTMQHPANHYPPVNPNAQDLTSALRILNERYAQGDISEEEYLKVKKNLTE